jgi:hypothetical protein
MTKANKWDAVEVEENKYEPITPGAYVAKIVSAEDVEDREYNLLLWDIAEGKFAGKFSDDFWVGKDYAHNYYASYKETALGMYKAMFLKLQESNEGFVFDGDEHNAEQFVELEIGIVLREEAYVTKSGEKRSNLKIGKLVPVADVRAGNVKPMPAKGLSKKDEELVASIDIQTSVYDEDMPF